MSNSNKKALIVWGGWEGHEPKQCADLFGPLLEVRGFDVTVSDTLDSFNDLEQLKAMDLILPIWTMGEIKGEQVSNLAAAVAEGTGLGGFHGGMGDAFRNASEYQFMVGGQFVSHPDGIKDYTVNIVDHDHPITHGIDDFKVHSEQYYMHVDPGNNVLATTELQTQSAPWVNGTVMPVVWTRMWGKGKVFYSSLGHVAADFEVSEVLEITKRGLMWCAR